MGLGGVIRGVREGVGFGDVGEVVALGVGGGVGVGGGEGRGLGEEGGGLASWGKGRGEGCWRVGEGVGFGALEVVRWGWWWR